MFYLYSDRGFYAGEGEDRAKWMTNFRFSSPFKSKNEAKQKGIWEKSKGRIKTFEIFILADEE